MNENMTYDADKTVIGGTPGGESTQMVSAPAFEATQYSANVDCPVCHTPNPPSEMYCMDCGFLLNSAPVDVSDVPKPESVGKLVSTDGALEFPLKRGENSIGRESSDVLLNNSTVSRKHGRIFVEDAGVFVEDMGSTNGTFVDGAKLDPNQKIEIKDGSEVTVGSVVLRFIAPEVAESEPVTPEPTQEVAAEPVDESPSDESPAESAGQLVPKDGGAALTLIEGTNTIGRREGANMLVIPDPYCSGRHADLTIRDRVFTLTDIGSTNGTLVNGAPLEANVPKQIQAGDEITFGRPVFKLEVGNG